MARITRVQAEHIMCQNGWLPHMSEQFRTYLLQNALLLKYDAGQIIFRMGDPAGGIFGLVSGSVIVNTAPLDSTPRLIHIAIPGGWTGEDSFMTGLPRKIELATQTETWVMHVPLEIMEKMAAADPSVIRAFGVITILSVDKLLRIVHDLQKKSVSSRIASVLHRMTPVTGARILVSQESIGEMTNTSRKQVNAVMKYFVAAGWIESGYRSIVITNPEALWRHSQEDPLD